MVGEQVELVQDEQNRTAAAAIAWPKMQSGNLTNQIRGIQNFREKYDINFCSWKCFHRKR